MAQPLTRSETDAAIANHGPMLQLHPDEQYVNCSIEWMLSHSTLIDTKDKTKNIVHPRPDQLPQGPKQGTQYYLEVEDSAKPGNFSTAKAYVNAFWQKGLTYTDLQFWFFSAYNGHGTALFGSLVEDKVDHQADINLAPLGEHWADWEYAAIRIDNASKEMIGIMLSEHGKNIFFDKAAVAKQFKMVNGEHPVVYSSLNGHANFPGVGTNFSEHHQVLGKPAGLDFNIVNATADGGLQFDCSTRYQVVAADWLTGTPGAYDIPAWVGYPYRWGPEGTTIHMKLTTLSEFIKAALRPKDFFEVLVLDDPITLLASELLHVFVKADINGAAAPATQAPWTGHYS
ncbi:uncharacterized protein LY89DRAFT_687318 [Mollisia scopiformis]|uniref:Uncharacterized protein n=1 Tax=Mollisia scopiformis TaxID=149040 RepID=A0A194X1H4_MOLSC|nr:uncharacterized protein LY89DRAFT_687318 [Mollisia scopiformis]KUJ14043.1 hypothetical protein LY89DRAFT_687318 [Mollisia scopiformis]